MSHACVGMLRLKAHRSMLKTTDLRERQLVTQKLMLIMMIAAAGGFGAIARYGLGGLVQSIAGEDFPWGTVAVNVLGCLLFGVIWGAVVEERWTCSVETRTVILVGFMGSFTTFSTFAAETGQRISDGQWLLALSNVAVQNIVGIAAFLLGWSIARLV